LTVIFGDNNDSYDLEAKQMNEQQLVHLKQLLRREKQEIEEQLTHNGIEIGMNDAVGELSGYDNHPADLGSELFERGKDLALQDADQHRLEEIDQALARIDNGSYGHCDVCGQEIAYERLEAVPWTTKCTTHQQQAAQNQHHPVEEELEIEELQRFSDDGNMFDREDTWQAVERYGTSNSPDYFQDGTSYDELLEDNDEAQGYVDLVEGFAVTDITGHNEGMPEIVHNEAYFRKERELDEDQQEEG
jgi:YteA family regulatory protein